MRLGVGTKITTAAELAIAIQGNLAGTDSNRKAQEYLSQYWMGTVLTLANLEPRIIGSEKSGTKPDFRVDIGGLDCAIEIKRPRSFHPEGDNEDSDDRDS